MSGEELAPQMAPVESPQMVIMNGDEPVQTTRDKNGVETKVPPKTAQAILARKIERKAKSILLLAIPYEYQLRFHTIKDAKSLWAAIKRNKNGDARYRNRDNNKRIVPVDSSDALVVHDNALIVQDGLGYDWSYIAQEEPTEFAHMAYTSRTDTEKNKVAYEEMIAVLEFKVKDKCNTITRLTNQLDKTLKEKEDLKTKLEQFEISSKNLNKLINSQLSTKDKTGLGYRDLLSDSDSKVLPSVFDSPSSDGDDNQTNDRFKKDDGYHVVSPPLTGNYMPPLVDLSFAGLDDFVYRPTANKASASISTGESSDIKTSNISVKKPKVDFVRASGVIIKDWHVNTATHKNRVNVSNSKINAFPKSHSSPRRPFYKPTVLNTRISKETVNTVRVNGVNTVGQTSVSTVKGNGVTVVKTSASYVWRPKMTDLNNVSKDSRNPQQALKYKGMFDSGCSRHMTGNKALLTDYQDINGGFVAFGGSSKGGKLSSIGKFDRKVEEGFLVGYSVNSKAFRVFNTQTKKVEENLHVNFLENKPTIAGQGPNWFFDIDSFANSMNYQPVTVGNQANKNVGQQEVNSDTGFKKNVDVGHTCNTPKITTMQRNTTWGATS
uniref:Retroviral polymerase SH3-like domain-containing protein n=1 Tax=Tanacetum cinerariifolium TaxID=118510 RepID=A0A6L2J3D5_TANCI|nr:hypothetical protein [Tanacetum cinerariifolium]